MIAEVWKNGILGILAIFLLAGVTWIIVQLFNREELPVIDDAEVFILEDTEGSSYNSDNQKVKLLTFFYTNCPDICPLTMYDFTKLQEQLKQEGLFGTEVELVAITLDPEVDTLDKIKTYAGHFQAEPSGWKFLRGTTSEIKEIADAYQMKYQKVTGGAITHNTTMYLIDQNNHVRGLYDMANPKERIDLEGIMENIYLLLSESRGDV